MNVKIVNSNAPELGYRDKQSSLTPESWARIRAGSKKEVMERRRRELTAVLPLCVLLLALAGIVVLTQKLEAQVTTGQVAGAAVGIAATGAAIGIGVFYAAHHGHSLTGCAASGSSGLQLLSDHQTWALVGEVNDIKPGERIRVAGKKESKNSANTRRFLVEKVSKNFGPCDGGRSPH